MTHTDFNHLLSSIKALPAEQPRHPLAARDSLKQLLGISQLDT